MALRGSSFCCKVNFIDIGEIRRLQFPCRNSLKRPHHLSSPPLKPCDVARHCRLKSHIGRRAQASRLLSLRACQVTSEDSEEMLSGESIILDEHTLMRDLQFAIKEENYAQAAKIRDGIRSLQEDSKASILAANARFYKAFRKGDLAAMQSLWAKGDNVCCVRPGANGVLGYDDVIESWEVVLDEL